MDHFSYQGGRLCAEDVPIDEIAESVGTPFYCYASATLERHYRVFVESLGDLDATVCFAVKANGNIAVLRTLGNLGAGADVVSGGEFKRARAAGIPASRIVFSGVGKTDVEIADALKAGVWQINVESEPELETISRIADSLGVTAPVAIRINPDVDARTHEKITTGKSENKFGIEWTRAHEVYTRAAGLPAVGIVGVAVHIGSQLLDLSPFKDAYIRMRDLVAMLRADGHQITRLDLGGGLGIAYDGKAAPAPDSYGALIRSVVGDLDCQVVLEPGRVIAGNAGILVTRVIYVKEGATRTFAVVDAAMNDLLRPALYSARHSFLTVAEPGRDDHLREMDVVGPICETADTFARDVALPNLRPGDMIAVRTAGAYCAVMASTYNGRPLVPEILVKGDRFAVVRERISVDDLLARESVPDWVVQP